MNTREFIGLDNLYAYALMSDPRSLALPYVVDEVLRETPIIEDQSFVRSLQNGTMCCNYLIPLRHHNPVFLELTQEEYNRYMFIRKNAFYTPYGMMILLDNQFMYNKYFILENTSLIPQERVIEHIGRNFNSPSYYSVYYATFFADFIMDKIILNHFYKVSPSEGEFAGRANNIKPVLMKRFKPINNIPVYDVQFSDLIAFDSQMSYDTYMLALSCYLSGNMADGDKLSFRFNPTYRLMKCYPKEHISLALNGSNAKMVHALAAVENKYAFKENQKAMMYEEMRKWRK